MNDPDVLDLALRRLPHGPEFRFIDRLTDLEPGKTGTGEYRIKGNENFLKGHFINQPILPGVILIEAVAQLAGVVVQSDPEFRGRPLENLKLTAVKKGKILGSAAPGEILVIKAEIIRRLGGLILASGSVLLNDSPLLVTEVTLSGEIG